MLFVSKFAAYRHVVSAGTMRWVRDPSGAERQIDNGDFFWAEFKLGGLEPYYQDLALQEFRKINPQHPLGAEPHMIDGTINMMDAASEGETTNAHEAYLPYQRLSRYDTEDGRMCPERWRGATETCLMSSTDFGRDFLRLDLLDLNPPWPTYSEMDAETAAAFALAGGIDIELALRYEKATSKREDFRKAFTAAKKAQDEQRAEAAALTVSA